MTTKYPSFRFTRCYANSRLIRRSGITEFSTTRPRRLLDSVYSTRHLQRRQDTFGGPGSLISP